MTDKDQGTLVLLDALVRRRLDERLTVNIGPGVTWADSEYMMTFFGVSAEQAARSTLPQYRAQGRLLRRSFRRRRQLSHRPRLARDRARERCAPGRRCRRKPDHQGPNAVHRWHPCRLRVLGRKTCIQRAHETRLLALMRGPASRRLRGNRAPSGFGYGRPRSRAARADAEHRPYGENRAGQGLARRCDAEGGGRHAGERVRKGPASALGLCAAQRRRAGGETNAPHRRKREKASRGAP